ncbi:MAG: hypothetical protein ACOY0T_10045 [Myxococcota bacterium]
MSGSSGVSLKTLLVANVASNLLLVGVVLGTCRHLERAIDEAGARRAEPVAPALVSATQSRVARAPISAEQFQVQWEARYAAQAEQKCWAPHFARYLELPGHLDLRFRVMPGGRAEGFELVGFRNPDDSPDPKLAQSVFECVIGLLREARYPQEPESYDVRGRVNRPNPPGGFGRQLPSQPAGSAH